MKFVAEIKVMPHKELLDPQGKTVANNLKNRKVFELIMANIPHPWRRYVDSTMYKSIQQFRCYMSTKYGKDRIKNIDPEFSHWDPEEFSDVPLRDTFLAYLVTYTADCQLIPIDDEDENEYSDLDRYELTGDDEFKIREIIKNMPYANYFKFVS